MQTEAATADHKEALLQDKPSKFKAKWSTIQLIGVFVIGMVISALATNMDRIVDTKSDSSSDPVGKYEFGHSARALFALDDEYNEFNFGAYGNAPHDVINYQMEKRLEIEACPSCWFKKSASERDSPLNELLQRLAQYLGIADWTDLAYIINASHGMNAVLRSITQTLYNGKCQNNITSCKVLQFNTAYGMVKNTLNFINNAPLSAGDQVIEFAVTKRMMSNSSYLLKELETFLENTLSGKNITIYMASVSHIASGPSVLYDVKSITQLFRRYDIITLIDAAHAMGSIDVNMTELDADIWLANGHKWLFSTRGSAVIYVKKEFQDIVFPAVISSESEGTMQTQFNYQGTMDDSIWLSMNGALDFRQKFGDGNIIRYLHNICIDGGKILTEMWNTSLLIYNEENIASMINPILPTNNQNEAMLILDRLQNEYYTLVPIVTFEGEWYMRVSCQIYHELSDFEWIGNAVLEILSDIRQT